MKKLISILLSSVISTSIFATVRTVSNADSAAQFRTIQAAIDASNAGDSIYVNGSPYNYDGFTLSKKLAIFGPGWSPAKDQVYIANVKGCTLRSATGSELHGLTFISNLDVNDDGSGINNVLFIRNKFQGVWTRLYYSISNCLFEGNWFDNSTVYAPNQPSYLTFRNNIFYQNAFPTGYTTVLAISGDNNNLFDHNLWYGPSTGSIDCFNSCSYLHLNNNIFVHRNAYNSNSNSVFRNNDTYLTGTDTAWASPNIDGFGNLAAINPQMADSASVNNGIDNPLLNFTISSGKANNAGTDAQDIGLIYNPGRLNWSRSRGADLPFVSKMSLQSNSILVGQKLRFTMDSKSN